MRLLVMGATGMLGHKVWQALRARSLDTWGTVRQMPEPDSLALFPQERVVTGCNLRHSSDITRLFEQIRPEAVINCAGVVKQVREAKDPIAQIELNALLPHRLATLCSEHGSRLIHFSTDCVYSGNRGAYSELHLPDPPDLYGRAKLLGEVAGPQMLTIRSSIIGRELTTRHGLLEWFLAQRGEVVKGFRRAIFSGLTTIEMANLVVRLLTEWTAIEGLYHIASTPITKYSLLSKIRNIFGTPVEIDPDDDVICDRSLDGTKFSATTGYVVPEWDEMLRDIAKDNTPYDDWRRHK